MSFEVELTERAARVVARRGGTVAVDFIPPIS